MNYHRTLLPRFGLVMGVMANRDLVAGEEVFVSYNYNIGKAPDWYQVGWLLLLVLVLVLGNRGGD